MNLLNEIYEQPEVLSSVYEKNREELKRIASAVKERGIKNVCFAARGTSDHACIFAQYLFGICAGIPCALGTPSVISLYGASVDLGDCLTIGVSQSGAAKDVLAVIEDAKATGGITVAVTNDDTSPLWNAAEYKLYCAAGPEKSIAATKTFTSQMMLLSCLVAGICGDEGLTELLAEVPSAVKTALDTLPVQINEMLSKVKIGDGTVLLGRGLAYPIALEGTLKITETNAMKLRGYAASDFVHGPLAQLREGDTAILLAPDAPSYQDMTNMQKRLKEIGVTTVGISDTDFDCDFLLRLPEPVKTCKNLDVQAAFTSAVALQLTAALLTEKRGIDPDASKVLKKVTVTY